MYKIFADGTLIYDSTDDSYKINKGAITLETNKSGSFSFSLYPDHFYYDKFVRLKTVITVYKSDKIVFRGRILNDTTDYWNNKTLTCEGELGFLQDSIIRPYAFNGGTPESLFKKLITAHNEQVDEFKRFKIGTVSVADPNDAIYRSNSEYENTLSNLTSRLIEDSLGGYFYITHGDDGTEEIPTIHYLADFTYVSPQSIEFGENLKDYTKTVKAEDIATAIIPLGKEIDDGNDSTENQRLNIAGVNNGVDYVYDEAGVSLYGWITKVVTWDDVTEATNLKRKAEDYLASVMRQNVTIELTAIDLHLLDKNIESFGICQYIRVTSEPHFFNETLLCNKQTLDLLKPDNDTVTLGYTYATFTEMSNKNASAISNVKKIQTSVNKVSNQVVQTQQSITDINTRLDSVDLQSVINTIYPVGSIYMSTMNTDPSERLGGTWVAWGSGRVPVGVDTSQTEFDDVEKVGGEKTHVLTVNEIPAHDHQIVTRANGVDERGTVIQRGYQAETSLVYQNTQSTGGGLAHNNLQPYITCYMWKRIA